MVDVQTLDDATVITYALTLSIMAERNTHSVNFQTAATQFDTRGQLMRELAIYDRHKAGNES